VAPLTLAEVRERADGVYPADLLDGCSTALILFAAGFHGAQDGIFVADKGLDATCVDIRPQRLHEMAAMYPASWEFFVDDVFDFVEETDRTWDVVSVDCPTNLFERCADMVGVWCGLAERAVVLGTGEHTSVTAPAGWRITQVVRRSSFAGGVYWTVLQPC